MTAASRTQAREILWSLDALYKANADDPKAHYDAFEKWAAQGMTKVFGFPEDLFDEMTPEGTFAEAIAHLTQEGGR